MLIILNDHYLATLTFLIHAGTVACLRLHLTVLICRYYSDKLYRLLHAMSVSSDMTVFL